MTNIVIAKYWLSERFINCEIGIRVAGVLSSIFLGSRLEAKIVYKMRQNERDVKPLRKLFPFSLYKFSGIY